MAAPRATLDGADPARTGTVGSGGDRSRDDPPAPIRWRAALKNAWPVFLAGLPALVTLIALAFDLFPALRPVTPPEVRRVEVTEAGVVERRRARADGEEVTAVFIAVESIGYDADTVEVATLWLEAASLRRVEPELDRHGLLTANTRTDRVVLWLDVPYPDVPGDLSTCLTLRVLLYPSTGETGGGESAETPAGEPAGGAAGAGDHPPYLLAYADTAPFDPFSLDDAACSAGSASPPP